MWKKILCIYVIGTGSLIEREQGQLEGKSRPPNGKR